MFTTAKELQREIKERAHGDGRAARAWLEAYWNGREDSLSQVQGDELHKIAAVYKQHGMGHLQNAIFERRVGAVDADKFRAAEDLARELPIVKELAKRAAAYAPDTVPSEIPEKLSAVEVEDVVSLLQSLARSRQPVRVVTRHEMFGEKRLEQAQGPIDLVCNNGEWSVSFVEQKEPRFPFGFFVRDLIALGEPISGQEKLSWDFGASRVHVERFQKALEAHPEISEEVKAYLKEASAWAPGPWSWTNPRISVNGDRVILSHAHGEAYYYPKTLAGRQYVAPPSEVQDPGKTVDDQDFKNGRYSGNVERSSDETAVTEPTILNVLSSLRAKVIGLFESGHRLFRAFAT